MDTNGCSDCDTRTNEELQCRICAEYVTDKNGRMHIFDEDAKRNYLQTKIRKYLYVLVSLEDRLPKMVCFTCIKRLESIHRFASMAHRVQERLKIQLYNRIDDSEYKIKANDKNDRGKAEEKEEEEGLLLRSILIGKGDEIAIPSSPLNCTSPSVQNSEDEENGLTEEMEVKVDPMIFLQCSLDRSVSLDDTDDETNDIKDISNDDDDDDDDENDEDEIPNKTNRSLIKSFSRNDNLVESSIKSFNCTICLHVFETQIGLQNHLWSHLPRAESQFDDSDKHSPINNQRIYANNSLTVQNCGMENSGGFNPNGSFICPICNKRISTKGNLKVHLETHRPKGKYGCDICGRIFKTQSNLFRHKEYHGGIQFPCSVCGRVYPTNSTLRAHSITHSDLRPHACPLCDKTFKRNQDLKFHINQHTGARPYQCPYCPKAFASSGNCFSHRKRMHPKEVHRDRQRAADLMR